VKLIGAVANGGGSLSPFTMTPVHVQALAVAIAQTGLSE
jgi:hypothetical protein